MNGRVNTMNESNLRVRSSNFDGGKGNVTSKLNELYEKEQELIKQRKNHRLRTNISNRTYHVDPSLDSATRHYNTDSTLPQLANDGTHIEHVWVETIDEALNTYIDGDIIELNEGKHEVSGQYPIFGKLLIRGVAASNWKTLIVNKSDSKQFIWCIGKDSRVTFENLLLRSKGAR